jgi:hypothetical protein
MLQLVHSAWLHKPYYTAAAVSHPLLPLPYRCADWLLRVDALQVQGQGPQAGCPTPDGPGQQPGAAGLSTAGRCRPGLWQLHDAVRTARQAELHLLVCCMCAVSCVVCVLYLMRTSCVQCILHSCMGRWAVQQGVHSRESNRGG